MISPEEQMEMIKRGAKLPAVGLYHDKSYTEQAEESFDTVFAERGIHDQIPFLLIDWEEDTLEDVVPLLVKKGFVQSRNEFNRLLCLGEITIEGEKITSEDKYRVLILNDVIKIGKNKFLRIMK